MVHNNLLGLCLKKYLQVIQYYNTVPGSIPHLSCDFHALEKLEFGL